jgi:hypothetical protein
MCETVSVHKQKNHGPHTLKNQSKSLNLHQEADSFPSSQMGKTLFKLINCGSATTLLYLISKHGVRVLALGLFLKKLLTAAQQLNSESSRAFGCPGSLVRSFCWTRGSFTLLSTLIILLFIYWLSTFRSSN